MTIAVNGPTCLTKLGVCKLVDPDSKLENIWQLFIYKQFCLKYGFLWWEMICSSEGFKLGSFNVAKQNFLNLNFFLHPCYNK